jgi:hypothetical protein
VHTDGGKEFLKHFSTYLRETGVRHTITCPYSSFQNSVVERRVRSLKEYTRRLMLDSGLPTEFWGRAMHTASVTLNQHPVLQDPVARGRSPFQIMWPDKQVPKLIVFGSVAYALIVPKAARDTNLKYPGKAGWFVGYSDFSVGYMIFDPQSSTFETRRDVHFDENWRYNDRKPPDHKLQGALDYVPAEAIPDAPAVQEEGGTEQPASDAEQGGSETLGNEDIRDNIQEASRQQPEWVPDDFDKHQPSSPPMPPDQPEQSEQPDPPQPTFSHPQLPQRKKTLRVAQHEADTLPPPASETKAYYIELFCGTSSFARAKFTKDSNAMVLGIDKMTEEKARSYIPAKFQHQFEYHKMDITDLTPGRLTHLCYNKLKVKAKQISAIHASPPCETYSEAHHGNNPHRNGTSPRTDQDGMLARRHDALNGVVMQTLQDFAAKHSHVQISIENPVSMWKHMPFTRKLLKHKGWIIRTADHCMHRRNTDDIFPRKRTSWILYNVNESAPFETCLGTCDCLVPTTNHHKLVICWREGLLPEQTVMQDSMEKGRIPAGIFDHIANHRLSTPFTDRVKASPVVLPEDPTKYILVDTGRGKGYIGERCKLVAGQSFMQIPSDFRYQYITKSGSTEMRKYQKSDLIYDLKNRFLSLQDYDEHTLKGMSLHEQKQWQSAFISELYNNTQMSSMMGTGSDPLNEYEADNSPEWQEWKAAKEAELQGLDRLHCWDIVDSKQAEGQKLYNGKFCFTLKPPANGQPQRYKARWVISDPKWTQRISGIETYAPTVRMETLRYVMAQTVQRRWQLIEIDICNAFVTSTLDKPVFMKLPKMLQTRHGPDKVAKVYKALYGLAYSPRSFHDHLNTWFKANKYVQSTADSCLWISLDNDNIQGCILEWVDDCVAAGTPEFIDNFRTNITKQFQIRDYGNPTDFVGMQVNYCTESGTLKLYQQKYIEKLGIRYGIYTDETTQDSPIPMNCTVRLHPAIPGEPRADAHEFRSIVGALHYAAHCVRPEIAAPISLLSKYLTDPTVTHLKQARHILQYLMATKTMGLTYRLDHTQTIDASRNIHLKPNILTGFADATWADDPANRRSQSGYAFMLNGAAVSWSSHQQQQVSNSSSEAEFRAYNDAAREALFLRKLEFDFNRAQSSNRPPTTIYNDNESAIKWLKNPCHHNKTKHIDAATLSVREHVSEFKTLTVSYCTTQLTVADVMTKALAKIKHWRHTRILLGLQPEQQLQPQSEGG